MTRNFFDETTKLCLDYMNNPVLDSASSASVHSRSPPTSTNNIGAFRSTGSRSALREYIPPPPDVTFTNSAQITFNGGTENDFDTTGESNV